MNPEDTETPPSTETEINDQIAQRLKNLEEWRADGIDPFGCRFDHVMAATAAKALFDESDPDKEPAVTVAGRITAMRVMGKAVFADLRDAADRVQIYVQKNVLGDDLFARFKRLDLGDIIGVHGTVFAYGQTSCGKTYTMQGAGPDSPGILQMAVLGIFERIEKSANRDFLLRVSYIEIYNEGKLMKCCVFLEEKQLKRSTKKSPVDESRREPRNVHDDFSEILLFRFSDFFGSIFKNFLVVKNRVRLRCRH